MPGRSRKHRKHILDQGYTKRKRYRSCSPSQEQATRKRFKQSISQQELLDTHTEIRSLKLQVDILTAQVKLLQRELRNFSPQTHEMEQPPKRSSCIIL